MYSAIRRLGQCGGLGLLACAVGCSSTPLASKGTESPYKPAPGPSPNQTATVFEGEGLKKPTATNLAYGKWKESLGQFAEARRAYEIVLSHDPKSADAVLGLARLDQLGGRHEEAERGFKRALQLKPNDPHALDALGQFYASREQWPEAISTLGAAMENGPNVPVYRFHLAVALAKSGDMDRAYGHFQQTVGEAEAHYNIALILKQKGEREEAARRLSLALSIKPDLREAKRLREELKQSQGNDLALRGGSGQGGNRRGLPRGTGNFRDQTTSRPSNIQQAGHDDSLDTGEHSESGSTVHADWKPRISIRETIVRQNGKGQIVDGGDGKIADGDAPRTESRLRTASASESVTADPAIEDWHSRPDTER